MKHYIIPIICLLTFYANSGSAKNYPHAEAGISFAIPDSWAVDADDDNELTAISPDDKIHLLFKVINANDPQAQEKIAAMLQELISDLEDNDDESEMELQDGLTAKTSGATGNVDGVAVDVGAMIIENNGKKVIVIGVKPSDTASKHEGELEAIASGIKRIK